MTQQNLDRFISTLTKHLPAELGELTSYKISFQQTLVFSEITKVILHYPRGTRNIVIKKLLCNTRKDDNLSLLVELEYKLLAKLYSQFSSIPKINVVKPITFFPDDYILVTEDFNGQKLDALIINQLRWFPTNEALIQINNFCTLSGRWLRYFQEITSKNEVVRFHINDFMKDLENKVNSAKSADLIPASDRVIYNSIDYKFSKLPEKHFELVGYHSDFTPWNVLAKDDEIRVCDFDRFSFRCRYDDLTLFLCCLEAKKSILGLSNRHIDCLKNSYLTGYDTSDIENDIFQLYLIKNTLKCVNWIDLSGHSNTKFLDIKYEEFRKKRELKTLLIYLKRLLNES